jgi:hypothetical protein
LLGTGYDNPAISAVFLCRNLSQWRTVQQYVGRAVRPSASIVGELVRFDGPENSAKRRAIIAASDKPDALIADLIGLDDKVIHASAIDVLYADESDEVRQQMAEDASRRQRQPQVGERDEIDDAARDAAKAEIARQQNDRLAALARQRAMAGDLPADVHVSYSGHSTVAPEIPTGRAVGTVGERARFVALSVAKYPDVHAARAIAEKMDRNQLRGMTAAVDRELRKQGARPDWRRADAAYPEYAASHGRKAPPMPPPQPRPAPKPQPTAVLPDGRTIWEF